jgi:hypothetical protein
MEDEMKSSKTNMIPAGSVDDSIKSPMSYASAVINMRWNADNAAWTNDRGLQPFWEFPASFTYSDLAYPIDSETILGSKVDSNYFWKKNTGESYIFIEQNGILYVVYGNKKQGTTYTGNYFFNDIVVIQQGRSTVGSKYIPFGNRLLIINGVDKPIWFKSPKSFRDFSFTLPTARPEAIDIQADYPQGAPLRSGTGAPFFSDSSIFGLGDTTGKTNNYFWRLSYILDSGSESPLSSSDNINWVVPQDAEEPEYKFGAVLELPTMPPGTVARRIYRTKNCLENEENYYFVKQINENGSNFFVDYVADTHLITAAPSSLASSIISTDYKHGENWDGRIWLAKEKRIIYSERGLPEQFNAVSFFDLGNTIGGNITAIKAYYNNLIVFRESAINLIRFSQSGYSLATLSTSVGTVAANAITIVPKFGLTFINEEGVWALIGGLDGGSQITVRKISVEIDTEWRTLNRMALDSVISAYSDIEKELWIHYPFGYSDTPNRGVVLHLERDSISWSFRKNEENDDYFAFSSITTDFSGRFCFGSVPKWTTTASTVGSATTLFGALHIWCSSSFWSQKATVSSVVEGVITYTVTETDRIAGEWISSWFEYQNGMARIYSVELEMIAQGDTELNLDYVKDFALDYTTAATQKQADGKIVFTKSEPPVTVDSTAVYSKITKSAFTVNSSRIYNERRLRLRYDINTGLSDNFKFKVSPKDNECFQLIGYKIDHKAQEIPIMNQAIRRNKGQPR